MPGILRVRLLELYISSRAILGCVIKHTGVELDLITNIDQLLFVESGIRGGICQSIGKFGRSNFKYMDEGYDPNQEENI